MSDEDCGYSVLEASPAKLIKSVQHYSSPNRHQSFGDSSFTDTTASLQTKLKNTTPIPIWRECLAECLGMFVLISFGLGSVAQNVLSKSENGSYLAVNIGWGMAVLLGILVSGQVSGAHLNPAVTVTLALHRRLPWKKVGFYVFAQMFGAFLGALAVYLVYFEALNNYDGGHRRVSGVNGTATIWVTAPQHFLNSGGGFVDQIFGTGLLLLCLFALSDPNNEIVSKKCHPFIVAVVVISIGICFGFNCGYAINPARDLGPRLFLCFSGWGSEVFKMDDYFFWIPIVGPLVGGALGSSMYQVFIGWHWPEQASKDTR